MEISKQYCREVNKDYVEVSSDNINRLEILIHTEYDGSGSQVPSHETMVILSKEDAIELAQDILIHYNVYMSA